MCDPSPREGVGRGLDGFTLLPNPSLPLHNQPHPSQGREFCVQEGNRTASRFLFIQKLVHQYRSRLR